MPSTITIAKLTNTFIPITPITIYPIYKSIFIIITHNNFYLSIISNLSKEYVYNKTDEYTYFIKYIQVIQNPFIKWSYNYIILYHLYNY
jgi:hypothetical protein